MQVQSSVINAEWRQMPSSAHQPMSAVSLFADYNFDHPDAFDHEALMKCLMDLKVIHYDATAAVTVPL